jgi:hypothetical protein
MNILFNRFKYFNSAVTTIICSAIILFSIVSYYNIQNSLNNITYRANSKLRIIENYLEHTIANANQIIYSLSLALINENIAYNNKNITHLVNSFDSKINRRKSIPLSGFKILDANDIVIYHSLILDRVFKPQKSLSDNILLAAAKRNPFELQVGQIRLGSVSQEAVIPLCMSINNNKNIGSICTCLDVAKLTKQITIHIDSPPTKLVKLKNITEPDNLNSLDNSFTLTNIIKSYLNAEPLIINQPLTKHPLLVEAEIDCYYLISEITRTSLICLVYFVILISFVIGFLAIHKRFYQDPLNQIFKRIYQCPSDLFNKTNISSHNLQELCIEHLSQVINHIIDYFYASHNSKEKDDPSSLELRNNILHLILTERHYCNHHKNDSTIEDGSLYLNELKKLINSKEKAINLVDLLAKTVSYCLEYYDELKINLVIENEQQNKLFYLKEAALTETIFTIFNSIIRIGGFDLEKEIIIRVIFNDSSINPIISVEAPTLNSSLKALGWQVGVTYVYSGLLSMYLLAKENNLFLYIKENDGVISFVLEPIDQERIDNANNLCKTHYH